MVYVPLLGFVAYVEWDVSCERVNERVSCFFNGLCESLNDFLGCTSICWD